MRARLAGVSSWGTTKALALETGLKIGDVCGWECGKGNDEGRQGTQGTERDSGLKNEKRCRCTGTRTFGLPPVFSGPVAYFISFMYAVFDPMILHVGPWWVLFQPCNQQLNSRGRETESAVTD